MPRLCLKVHRSQKFDFWEISKLQKFESLCKRKLWLALQKRFRSVYRLRDEFSLSAACRAAVDGHRSAFRRSPVSPILDFHRLHGSRVGKCTPFALCLWFGNSEHQEIIRVRRASIRRTRRIFARFSVIRPRRNAQPTYLLCPLRTKSFDL